MPEQTLASIQAWTLMQPFASGIALGARPDRGRPGFDWKDVENRPQRRRLGPEGRWYGLHAGAGWWDVAGDRPPWFHRLGVVPYRPWSGDCPKGVMLGAFHVRACVRYPGDAAGPALLAETDPFGLHGNPSAFGPWCFVIDEVRLLPEPIPCRGMQGSWPVLRSAGPELANALLALIVRGTT
jgi:hypothetical protein